MVGRQPMSMKGGLLRPSFCAVAGALLVISAAHGASAEPSADVGHTMKLQQPVTVVSPAPDARHTRKDVRPWSLEDALPKQSSALRDSKPEKAAGPGIGRLPIQSGTGSIGFETETMVKPNELPDGRPVSNLEETARQKPSYLGFSLSVPTDNKTIIPLGPQ
jgi:hypothetical protein